MFNMFVAAQVNEESVSGDLPIIYVLDASVAVTGAFVAVRNAARILKDEARIVLVLPAGSRISAEELCCFWRVEYLPIVNLSRSWGALLRYMPVLLTGAWSLRRMMKKDGAARLWLNDFYLMHGIIMRLLGFNGHIVSWVRGDPALFVGFLARPMLYLVGRSAGRIVAVSSYIRSLLPADLPAEIIYDCYMEMPQQFRHVADEKTFVYIANYIVGKGQDVALAAFSEAAAQDRTIRLCFYGGDMGLQKNRDYRRRLESMAYGSGMAARVTFGDFLVDTSSIFQTAFAALNFSANESFSMTVLEASGAGLPVIATACGGPQEIIRDGITGYLIAVGDVHAAAQRILALAGDAEMAAGMGHAAAAHVRMKFSPQEFHARVQSVLTLPNQAANNNSTGDIRA